MWKHENQHEAMLFENLTKMEYVKPVDSLRIIFFFSISFAAEVFCMSSCNSLKEEFILQCDKWHQSRLNKN